MLIAAETNESLKPKLEIAEIFRAYGGEYLCTHRVTKEQQRVMNAIILCRTAALGGHVEECDACGHQCIAYNSCRNRHCPKCQSLKQALWVEEREAELLPIEYFHVVFTLPHQLNELARWHPREVYDLLFASATQSLGEFGRRELGGVLGITAVLHTWGQTLQRHIHLHCIVTGGAESRDGESFRRCRQGFLCSVETLSKVYRENYCAGLRRWAARVADGVQLTLAKWLEELSEELSGQPWVVYAKQPMAGPEQVIGYLGRYTQRVAISNGRLLGLSDGVVSFRWKDYQDGDKVKEMSLPAEEFIRRYLQHVLPAGYVRIRHYGLLASRGREARLARCRELLQAERIPEKPVRGETIPDLLLRLTGRNVRQCEQCGNGRMKVIATWKPGETPPDLWIVAERQAA